MNAHRMRSGFVETADGLRLYWHAVGRGPSLVCCNGLGVSTFFWKYLVEQFSDRYQVVVWDYRGHGRSDRPADPHTVDLSVPTMARDLGLVLDAVNAQEHVLLGHSMGCQLLLERYRQAPEGVTGLVLLLGGPGRVLSNFGDNPRSPQIFKVLHLGVEALGDRINRVVSAALRSPLAWPVTRSFALVDPLYTSKEDFQPYLEHLASMDFRLFMRLVVEAQKHDARDVLPTIKVPTLVVAAERDDFFPLWLMRDMAARIPGSSLLVLADGSHAAIIEQPRTINHRLERFLKEQVRWATQQASLRPAS